MGLVGVWNPKEFCFGRDEFFYLFFVAQIHEMRFDAEALVYPHRQAIRTTVEVVGGNDFIAGVQHPQDGIHRSHSAGKANRIHPVFQSSKVFLEYAAGRVLGAAYS